MTKREITERQILALNRLEAETFAKRLQELRTTDRSVDSVGWYMHFGRRS